MLRTLFSNKMLFRQLFDRTSCTYTYLLADLPSRNAILIDPVDTLIDRDIQLLRDNNLNLRYAVNTHAHADHISASGLLKQRLTDVQSVIGKVSGAKADIHLDDGENLEIGGNVSLTCIYTPGHTEGCVSYFLSPMEGQPGIVFTGDTLMVRGCGRTDFQGGDANKLFASVTEKLFTLPGDTLVYPAHDYRGHTMSTIGEEKLFNPRLGKGKTLNEFVEIMGNLNLAYPKMIDKAVPANLNCGIPPPL